MATQRMIDMAAQPDRHRTVVGCMISDGAAAVVPNRTVFPEPWEARLAAHFVQRHARDIGDVDFLARSLGIGGV